MKQAAVSGYESQSNNETIDWICELVGFAKLTTIEEENIISYTSIYI
jgi:hypothetical protein